MFRSFNSKLNNFKYKNKQNLSNTYTFHVSKTTVYHYFENFVFIYVILTMFDSKEVVVYV